MKLTAAIGATDCTYSIILGRFRCYGYIDRHLWQHLGRSFRAIFDACEIRALDENEQKEYKATMTTQWDLDDQMTTAYLKGEAKGETKKRNEIARALLSLGVFEDIIAKATEMTVKEVEALKHPEP